MPKNEKEYEDTHCEQQSIDTYNSIPKTQCSRYNLVQEPKQLDCVRKIHVEQ